MAALALLSLVGCGSDIRPSAVPAAPSQDASPGLASQPAMAPPTIPWYSDLLPAPRRPGTTASPAGVYGWEGAPSVPGRWRDPSGMHRVLGDGGDSREVAAMLFAVGPGCLKATQEQQVPVRVAGFDGVVVEPYKPVVAFGTPHDDQITRAYALAVGDRTLCVYLTWGPRTTADEVASTVQILDTLKAAPVGSERVRVVFTLKAGWDTG